jgi:hypothetical protein
LPLGSYGRYGVKSSERKAGFVPCWRHSSEHERLGHWHKVRGGATGSYCISMIQNMYKGPMSIANVFLKPLRKISFVTGLGVDT